MYCLKSPPSLVDTKSLKEANGRTELGVVRRTEPSDWVPASCGVEPAARQKKHSLAGEIHQQKDNARGTTSGILADRNFVQRRTTRRAVQEGIKETERALASGDELVIQERDDRGEYGRGGGGATDEEGAVPCGVVSSWTSRTKRRAHQR